jgi:hypothetical protein
MLKYLALSAAAIALCAVIDPAPAAAQAPNCGDMYNRLLQVYQMAPQSIDYARMSASYSASCVGPSAGSAYPSASYPAAAGYGYSPAYVYGAPSGGAGHPSSSYPGPRAY